MSEIGWAYFCLNQATGWEMKIITKSGKIQIRRTTRKSYFSIFSLQSFFCDFFFSFMLLFDGCGNVKWANEWNDVDYGTRHLILVYTDSTCVCVCSFEQRPACSFVAHTEAIAKAKHSVSSVDCEQRTGPWAVSKRA